MDCTVKIFVCHHKPGPAFASDTIIPIHAGKALSSLSLDMIGDDTGDSISQKNPTWCELTVLYWMWKNVTADYLGLFHYRRYLSFEKNQEYTLTEIQALEQFGYTDATIKNVCQKADIIIPNRYGIHPVGLPFAIQSAYAFYTRDHFRKDLDLVCGLVKTTARWLYPSLLATLADNRCFFWNMAIMRQELLHEYCSCLFPILEEAERRIDISGYDSYQKRLWGFLAERMLNAYVHFATTRKKKKELARPVLFGIFDSPRLDIEKTRSGIKQQIANAPAKPGTPETINVAFAIDENYAAHCASAIRSMLVTLSPSQKIRIFILNNDDLSLETKRKFARLTAAHPGADIEYVSVQAGYFADFIHNRPYISVATYYRLKLQELLPPEIEKIIYLDADIIVADNIAELWEIELGDNFAAGAKDEGGINQTRRLRLPLTHEYVNAGVTIFNLKKIRKIDAETLYLESLYKNFDSIALQDQDILNIAFVNNIKVVPLRWNANARLYRLNDLEHSYSQKEAEEAAKNPGIIHYTDSNKPWDSVCEHPFKDLYLENRKKSGWDIGWFSYNRKKLFSRFQHDGMIIVYVALMKIRVQKTSGIRKLYLCAKACRNMIRECVHILCRY